MSPTIVPFLRSACLCWWGLALLPFVLFHQPCTSWCVRKGASLRRRLSAKHPSDGQMMMAKVRLKKTLILWRSIAKSSVLFATHRLVVFKQESNFEAFQPGLNLVRIIKVMKQHERLWKKLQIHNIRFYKWPTFFTRMLFLSSYFFSKIMLESRGCGLYTSLCYLYNTCTYSGSLIWGWYVSMWHDTGYWSLNMFVSHG